MRFRRKQDEEPVDAEAAEQETVETPAPDDAAWALPADAAVASGGDVAPAPAEEDRWESGDPEVDPEPFEPPRPAAADEAEPISAARTSSPGAGFTDGPRAAAAAAAGSFAQPPEADATPAPGSAADRPELLVAGAFVGAFLFAKIIKRIGD